MKAPPPDIPLVKPGPFAPPAEAPGNFCIVTGADAGYFKLLMACLASIRDKPEGAEVRLYVADLGLEHEQRAEVAKLATKIFEPGWDFPFFWQKEAPGHLRALTMRPFLPRYLPGHDYYLWIDADAELQLWEAVPLFLRAAATGAIAIVPEIDRAYRHYYQAWEEFQTVHRRAYSAAFDAATAEDLQRHPLLNAGVFALKSDAPHWQAWGETLAVAFNRTKEPLAEQAALNAIIYRDGLPACLLPARYNWICHHAPPRRDPMSGLWTEPGLPHQPLAIIHWTMWMKG